MRFALTSRALWRGGSGRKRNATQHLSKPGTADGREAFVGGKGSDAQTIRDRHQLIWVSALIAVAANGGCYAPDRHGAVAINASGDVAQTIGCRSPGKSV